MTRPSAPSDSGSYGEEDRATALRLEPTDLQARGRAPDMEYDDDSSDGYSTHKRMDDSSLWQSLFGPPVRIDNQGSTARDYLARERNLLSWVKLSCYLAVISAAMLLRFQLGDQAPVEAFQRESEIPLGVLFFVASMTSLVLGLSEYLSSDKLMRRQAGFVYSGWSTRILVTSIGGLALATCVLLLVAKEE